jgi:N-acetylglucosaminyldiphosphoundecaprenol N-acetyl-beta-D-mannosaminyltransferase
MATTLEVEQLTSEEERCEQHERVELFGTSIDVVRMQDTLNVVQAWSAAEFDRCRYVVTPNVDHIVMLQHHAGLQTAYRDADLIIADGWPVVTAARFVGKPLPERVPGSDLVPLLLKSASSEAPLRVFLLGAAAGVGDRAAKNIANWWPGVQVVGVHSPPLGFETQPQENEKILQLIERAEPDVLIVGLGAPKQELWVHAHRERLRAKVALCVGATIDFLAGEKTRAPRWMQRLCLEWLHRMLSEPRRLAKRYARDAWIFPQIVWKQWRKSRCRN